MVRFEEVALNCGVDSNRSGHEWMMVPYGGDNLVRLAGGTGFTVPPLTADRHLEVNEVFAKDWPRLLGLIGAFFVPKDDRLFRVTGKRPGPATLIAKKDAFQTTLHVSVLKPLTFTVAFFFLQDQGPSGIRPRTAFTPSDADKWIDSLNAVFKPQANISFKKVKAELLPVENLTAAVSHADAEMLAAKKEPSAQINIFLAGPNIKSDSGEPNGFYDIPQKLIILKDRFVTNAFDMPPNPMLETMAHEIAHLMNYTSGGFGKAGHDFYKDSGYNFDIMNTIDGGNIKIPHRRVLEWNPEPS